MEPKLFATVFVTVFLAEMFDKTQMATLLYSSRSEGARWTVFAASALALVAASGIGVLAGHVLSKTLSERTVNIVAGAGFIVVGVWTLIKR